MNGKKIYNIIDKMLSFTASIEVDIELINQNVGPGVSVDAYTNNCG